MHSIPSLLEQQAKQFKHHEAIKSEDLNSLRYSQLFTAVINIAHQLDLANIQPNDCVMLIMPQGANMTVTTLGIMCHCICLPFNPEHSESDFKTAIQRADVKCVVYLENEPPLFIDTVIQLNVKTLCLSDNILLIDSGQFNPRFKKQSSDTALILFTSGSTQLPKMVAITHHMLLSSACNVCESLSLSTKDRCLNIMPPFHIGAIADLTIAPLLSGGSIVIANDSNPSTVWRLLEQQQPTWLQGVPTMLSALLSEVYPTNNTQHLSLRLIRSVSSALPSSLYLQLSARFNVPIIEIYGMTEAAGVIASNTVKTQKPQSVGKAFGCQLQIVDNFDQTLPPNSEGEIVISGDSVITQYLSHDTANHFIGKWLKTGDLGYLDNEGFLFISGRVKDLINRGGEKISPLEIDALTVQLTQVKEAAAFAIPHASLGEDIALAVVCKPNQSLTEQTVLEFLKPKLASYKLPRKVYFIDALPRAAGGKLQRHLIKKLINQLTSQHTQQQGTQTLPQYYQPTSPLQRSIQKIWKQLLNVDDIQADSDFFDLGGDSLKAVELTLQLESQLSIQATPALLLDYPNFEPYCQQIKNLNTPLPKSATPQLKPSLLPLKLENTLQLLSDSWGGQKLTSESVVSGFNTQGTQPPFFWCSQGGNEIVPLAKKMGEQQPVYAMRSLYKVVKKHKRNYALLAERYIQDILSIQSKGPFYLGGFCAGAEIMLEIARQLIQQNHEVGLLALYEHHTKLPYAAPVALFHCKDSQDSPFALFHYAEHGLAKVYSSSISSYIYPWRHGDCFSDEHLAVFSQHLSQELHDSQNQNISLAALQTVTFPPVHKSFNQHAIKTHLPRIIKVNDALDLSLDIYNQSSRAWPAYKDSGVGLTYQWFNHQNRIKGFGTLSEALSTPLQPKAHEHLSISIDTPQTKGLRCLQIGLTELGVGWIDKPAFKQWVWVR